MHRNFLLFIPATAPNLSSVISYYSSTLSLNPEGDVVISDATIQSIGTAFLRFFFGAILDIAKPASKPPAHSAFEPAHDYDDPRIPFEAQYLSPPPPSYIDQEKKIVAREQEEERETMELDTEITLWENTKAALTHALLPSGYFVAGALSGAVSRTSTAPLDRLRVYLIAQTGTAQASVQAAKSGAPAVALKHAGSTLVNAVKDLWAAGGIRSLFAGKSVSMSPYPC